MIIYSMTATFGKLENETLRFEKGLNIIEAPNEWGKSTWCAFLLAMFYGIDTKSRSSKQAISDKERFRPWSGSPMEGRIELQWQGRDITIERTTHGRIPMGVFRAYETASGISVPELRGDNCGEMILGVECSVYKRSGYIRTMEMSITNDETLRNRLNYLVTTGDDSGEEAVLGNGLKELKNRLQYHKSGLIPQLEEQVKELSQLIRLAENNAAQLKAYKLQKKDAESELEQLQHHLDSLENQRAQQDQEEVKNALRVMQLQEQKFLNLRDICSGIPNQDIAQSKTRRIQETERELNALKQAESLAHDTILQPESVYDFLPGHGAAQARADAKMLRSAKSGLWFICFLLGTINIVGAVFLSVYIKKWPIAAICGFVGLIGLWLGIACRLSNKRKKKLLLQKYGSFRTDRWEMAGMQFDQAWLRYMEEQNKYSTDNEAIKKQIASLEAKRIALLDGRSLSYYYEVLRRWSELEEADKNYHLASENYQALKSMARSINHLSYSDELKFTQEETEMRIANKKKEIDSVWQQIREIEFFAEKNGSVEKLYDRKNEVQTRLKKLRKIYASVLIAQQTQQLALEELHRRFSPGITKTAQEYLLQMSAGKYNKLQFQEDFSAYAGSDQDTVLHSSQYRSEGTIDQIYFALRLAVAQELIPQVPLILDDAFIRFDDERLKSTLQILKKLGESKQIILFSCQNREKILLT